MKIWITIIKELIATYTYANTLINKKKNARQLFQMCTGRKYHLSTYMTAYDRQKVLQAIREELKSLDEDFPDGNIPEERRITIISTSLIEAGVDLDVYTVFRELNETYQFIYVSILLFFKPFLSKSIVYRRMSNCLG